MDAELVPQDEERGWSVFVLHLPVEGGFPPIPDNWVFGVTKILDRRQIMAAWDPDRWELNLDGEELIFQNATERIMLKAR